jgi:DNA-binding LacI/PurR family transcriptional regulator
MSEINQQTIADQLGLSRATVSRCFTNHAGISAVTRAKVFQLAAELGYTHLENRSPAAKKARKRSRFSVLICTDPDEYLNGRYQSPGEKILAGISEYAQNNEIRLSVDFVPPGTDDVGDPAISEIKSLKNRKNRGVLLIYPFRNSLVEQLSLRYPLVSLVEQQGEEPIDCVDVDHYAGISTTVDHLLSLGHRRIGFYTRDYPIKASWSFRRYSAFIEKMARKRIKVRSRDILGIFPRTFEAVEPSIAKAAERTKDGVTAWVCAADHQAYDLIDGFKAHGLKVPKDVSITGYDGIVHRNKKKPLTTIEIPFRSIGMTGAERLDARIRKRFGGRQNVYISGKLIKGKTTAKPC